MCTIALEQLQKVWKTTGQSTSVYWTLQFCVQNAMALGLKYDPHTEDFSGRNAVGKHYGAQGMKSNMDFHY